MKVNLLIGIGTIILAVFLAFLSWKGLLRDGWLDKAAKIASVVSLAIAIIAFINPFSNNNKKITTQQTQIGSSHSPTISAGGNVSIAYIRDIVIDGQHLRINADQIRQNSERTINIESYLEIGSKNRLLKGEIKKLAEHFGLLQETHTNPHLSFLEGDISYWEEQGLSEDRIKLEFAARKAVLEAADQQRIVISDQGKLSWAAQQIMSDMLKARSELNKAKSIR